MIIYKVQNKINAKIYIGQTKRSLNQRILEHFEENNSYIQSKKGWCIKEKEVFND